MVAYEPFEHERPLFGYELSPPDPKWPGGAKMAIVFTIDYHEGAEKNVDEGDAESESQ